MSNVFNINARDPDYWNVGDNPGVRNENWMRSIPDHLSVNQLAVPGTHNTMALYGGSFVQCQSLSLMVQLFIGIRFLDIRLRHFRNGLPVHHGAFYQKANFRDVLGDVVAFLDTHLSEFIFMKVKKEYDEAENTRSFSDLIEETITAYGRYNLWLEHRIPSVNEARGKIIIVNDFNFHRHDLGILRNTLHIEDSYNAPRSKKWELVRGHLDAAQRYNGNDIYLTFSSSTPPPIISQLARSMNPKLHSYVRNASRKIGIVAIDYPGPGLVTDIIQTSSFW